MNWAEVVYLLGLAVTLAAAVIGLRSTRWAWIDPQRQREGRRLAWVALCSGLVLVAVALMGFAYYGTH